MIYATLSWSCIKIQLSWNNFKIVNSEKRSKGVISFYKASHESIYYGHDQRQCEKMPLNTE